jgi:hypothetical protein
MVTLMMIEGSPTDDEIVDTKFIPISALHGSGDEIRTITSRQRGPWQ